MKHARLAPLLLLLAACGGSGAYTTPEACATAYLQAIVDGDRSAVRAMTAPSNHDFAYNMGEEVEPEPTADIRSFTIVGTVDHTQFATVDADVELSDGTTHLYRIMLIRRGDEWLVGRRGWMIEDERR